MVVVWALVFTRRRQGEGVCRNISAMTEAAWYVVTTGDSSSSWWNLLQSSTSECCVWGVVLDRKRTAQGKLQELKLPLGAAILHACKNQL